MNDSYGVLILAGGKSERMIFPKPYLLYKGKTFLENIAHGYSKAGMKNICLVIKKEHCEGEWKQYFERIKPFISIIEKTNSAHGRFHSVKLGLQNFSNMDYCFVHNVDNPFIDMETIKCLWKNKNSLGYTIALHKGRRGHPLLISKKIIQEINTIKANEVNLKDFLNGFPKRSAEVNSKEILLNINTPEDYEHFVTYG